MEKELSENLDSSVCDKKLAVDASELWDFQLDLLGTGASVEALQAHLDKAPNPDSANAQFLMGYLAGHANSS